MGIDVDNEFARGEDLLDLVRSSSSCPVLVILPAEFNEATKLPLILPITNSGDFARRLGFAVYRIK